jgi:hypothetical protein
MIISGLVPGFKKKSRDSAIQVFTGISSGNGPRLLDIGLRYLVVEIGIRKDMERVFPRK